MHHEALAFVAKVIGPLDVSKERVAEIGSYNVNGSIKLLFAAAQSYIGIDSREGLDVDIVSEAKDWDPKETFTLVVTCETLEHADTPADITDCAYRILEPGGLLILTAAGPDREPHNSDGGYALTGAYTAIDKRLLGKLLSDGWDDVTIAYGASHGNPHGDIYATARKAKAAKKAKAVAEPKDEPTTNETPKDEVKGEA